MVGILASTSTHKYDVHSLTPEILTVTFQLHMYKQKEKYVEAPLFNAACVVQSSCKQRCGS